MLSSLSTSGSTASTSSTSSTSGANTVVIYSPYPYPVFGDFGHRYYGKYYDHGCGCDRYAAPTYTAPTYVAATQVSSVPKGGVDTGDGSFQ
ncbi:hypothetical protein GCM10023201_46980 [Actinomycetospora corticicola]